LSRLRRGELDALISSSRLVDPGIEYVPLHVEDYVFVASPELLDERPLTCPEHAEDHVLLDCAPSVTLFRYHLDARPDGHTLDFAAHEYLGTIGAIRARVLAGAGVAVLPRYFIRDDLETGRLTVLFPDIIPAADSFRLIWPTGHRLTPELVLLGESLRQRPLQ
jgi:DNA-binding transcriptional LysR family regulator